MLSIIRKCLLFIFAMPILLVMLCFSKTFMYVLSFLMGFSGVLMGLFAIYLMDDFHIVLKLSFLTLGISLLTLLLFSFKEQMKFFCLNATGLIAEKATEETS